MGEFLTAAAVGRITPVEERIGELRGQATEKRKQNIECPNCGLSVSLSDLFRGRKRTCGLGLHPEMFGIEVDSKKMTQIS